MCFIIIGDDIIFAADALRIINYELNIDILHEDECHRVCNCVCDFCPGESRIARRIKNAYESGAVKMLADSKTDRQVLFLRVCQRLADYSEVPQDVAEETMSYFYDALKWQYVLSDNGGGNKAESSRAKDAAGEKYKNRIDNDNAMNEHFNMLKAYNSAARSCPKQPAKKDASHTYDFHAANYIKQYKNCSQLTQSKKAYNAH